MDVTWQELMAITELQFDVPGEASYDPTQYQSMESMVPVGGYGMTQPPPPATAADLNGGNPYDGCYSAETSVCHQLNSNTDAMYAHPEPQLNQRMLPVSSHSQPPLMAPREHMSINQGHRRPNACLPQGRHMLWTAHGQIPQARSAEDLESDSGLSLGSSPPLASPENNVSGAQGYQGVEIHMAYSDGEAEGLTEQTRGLHMSYSMDFQNPSHSLLHSGAHMSYFQTQTAHSHTHPNVLSPWSVKQQGQPNTVEDMYSDAGVACRGSSQHNPYVKQSGSTTTPTPLSRDERRALALKIPFALDKIINLPVDDFNELLTQYTLTDSQLALVRDIRRRGKNKVAAQNCRKRKLESIIHLERELNQLQAQRQHLAQERQEFKRSLTFIKCRLADLYSEVFSQLRDEDGQPYSVNDYSLQQTPDGKIYLVPHTAMHKRDQC